MGLLMELSQYVEAELDAVGGRSAGPVKTERREVSVRLAHRHLIAASLIGSCVILDRNVSMCRTY